MQRLRRDEGSLFKVAAGLAGIGALEDDPKDGPGSSVEDNALRRSTAIRAKGRLAARRGKWENRPPRGKTCQAGRRRVFSIGQPLKLYLNQYHFVSEGMGPKFFLE